MKTTLDLPDALLVEAKAVAARRRTTLKAMVEHALRREIQFQEDPLNNLDPEKFELNDLGFPVLTEMKGFPSGQTLLDHIKDVEGEDDMNRASL